MITVLETVGDGVILIGGGWISINALNVKRDNKQ